MAQVLSDILSIFVVLKLFSTCDGQSIFLSITRTSGGCPNYDRDSLRPNTTYTISTSTISPGQSAPDPPLIETFVTDVVPPNILKAWNVKTDEFSIYWRPTDPNQSGPFTVEARDESALHTRETESVEGVNDITLQDLNSGSLYEVTLSTEIGEIASASFMTRPRPISLLTLKSATTTSLGLGWAHSDTDSSYEICYHAQDGNPEFMVTSSNELDLTNLLPGTVYTISITAIVDRNGLRGASTSVYRFFSTVSPTLPTTPTFLNPNGLSANSVRLSWGSPAGSFDAFELDYRPQFGYPPPPIRIAPDQQSIQLDYLMASTEYQFSLVSTKGRRLSRVQSPPTETTFQTADGPFDVQVHSIRDRYATILYGAEPSAHRYRILYWSVGTSDMNRINQMTQEAENPRIWRIFGLVPNTTYIVVVAALSENGSTINDAATEFKTALPASVRTTVTQYTATSASIALPPLDDAIDRYRIQLHFGGDGGFGAEIGSPIIVEESICPRLELENLRPDSLYEVETSLITGESSTVSTVVGVSTRPLGPEEIVVSAASTTSLDLIWQERTDGFDRYRLRYVSDSSGGEETDLPSSATGHVITGLQPGTVYMVTLDQIGDIQDTRVAEVATRPLPPTNIRITNLQTQSVDVTWDSSQDMFEICYSPTATLPSPYITSDRMTVFNGLVPDSDVHVMVRAVLQLNGINLYGEGVSVSQRTLAVEPGDIQVNEVTTTTINVSWIGLPGTNTYTIDYFDEDETTPRSVDTLEANYTLIGLTPGALYNISVMPSNGVYQPFNIVTRTKPTSPMTITVTRREQTFISLNWTDPADESVNYTYMVQATDPGVGQVVVSESNVTVDNLVAGTTYNFSLTSISGSDATRTLSGAAIIIVTTTIPDLLIDSVGSSSLEVSWSQLNVDAASTLALMYSIGEGTGNSISLPSDAVGSTIRQLSPAGSNVSMSMILLRSDDREEILGSGYATLYPSAVSDLSCVAGRTELNARWTIVGSLYDGFVVQHQPMDGRILGNNVTTASSSRIIGLTPGQEYMITVTTTHAGLMSEPQSCTVLTRPEDISLLRAVDDGGGRIRIVWSTPPATGIPISEYRLLILPGGSQFPDTHTQDASRSPVFVYEGDTGLYYDIRLTSVVRGQEGTVESNPITTSILLAPEKVELLPLSDEQIGATSIALAWRVSGARSRLELTYETAVGGERNTTILGPLEESITIQGLSPATAYNLSIVVITDHQVLDGDLLEARSEPTYLMIETKLLPPRNLTTDVVLGTEIQWIWLPPEDGDNNYTYEVQVTPGDIQELVNRTRFEVTGLMGQTEYVIMVRSVIGSSQSNFVRHAATTLSTRPSIITGFRVPEGLDPSPDVTLVWSPPDPDDGVTRIQLKINGTEKLGDGEDSRKLELGATQTIIILENLRPGYVYNFSICAINEYGTSDPATVGPIEVPRGSPPPSILSRVRIISTTQTTMYVEIPDPFLSDVIPPVERYALLVTRVIEEDVTVSARPPTYLQSESSTIEIPYQTTLIGFDPYQDREPNGNGRYDIGTDEECVPESNVPDAVYCNGPLRLSTSYRVSLREYSVDGSYKDSPWSEPAVTQFDTLIIILIAVGVGIVVILVLILFCCVCCCCKRSEESPQRKKRPVPRKRKLHPENTLAVDVSSLDDFRLPGAEEDDGNQNSDSDDIFVPELTSYKRKTTLGKDRKKRHYNKNKNPGMIMPRSRGTPGRMASTASTSTEYANGGLDDTRSSVSTLVATPSSNPIIISKFGDHVGNYASGDNRGFRNEFMAMRNIKNLQPKEAGNLPNNKSKNRYKDILPYDYNRVKLLDTAQNRSDYINASNVKVMTWSSYIVTQGPLPGTVQDFWQMVWENRSTTIVMLSKVIEIGKVRCEKYWPEAQSTMTFGDFAVTCTDVIPEENWQLRIMSLTKEEASMTISQFHFTGWPDRGVPSNEIALLEFAREVRKIEVDNLGPTLVHCSAGCGRSGTYIALEGLIRRVEMSTMNEPIDVLNTTFELRKQRMAMVQSVSQYAFLHQCLLTFIQEMFF